MNEIELRNLISSWLDETIEPQEFRALSEMLRESEASRSVYFSVMAMHAELYNLADGERYLQQLTTGAAPPVVPSRRQSPHALLGGAGPWLALAASLLIAVGVWSFSGGGRPIAENDPAYTVEPLADARQADDDCRWYLEYSGAPSESAICRGDVVRVANGELHLVYRNGVRVTLRAPAAYELLSGTKSRLLLGRLTADVPAEGTGFSVVTPRATVVDLGTEFGLNVESDGATDVVVFQGEVDVDFHSDGSAEKHAQRLQMGEAVRLDAAGTASRVVSIRSHDYSGRQRPDDRPPIIDKVWDNIERMSSLNFYEIVQQGMREDALAFADREAHQWNGVDASGMPAYLVGGDYVKTFNNDKFNHTIRIGVKLSAPGRLYVLLDNRLKAPQWLLDGFKDTGDDIGLDVGPFFTSGQWHNKGPSGVGPGVSVEDTFSVWVKEIAEPSDVYLGATEAPRSQPNMYGIVAVRLEEFASD